MSRVLPDSAGRVPVELGPVPGRSVLEWADSAQRTVDALREHPELGVPGDVVDDFEHYVAMWRAAAADDTTFRWTGAVEVARVRRLAGYWALLASTARAVNHPDGIEPAPAQARPFYDALVRAMTDVLSVDDADRFADKFEEVAPEFEAQPPPGQPAAQDTRTTVLLVDDTEDIRLLFRVALQSQLEFEVFGEAANGQEALDALNDGCPDAILLDLMMPVMDGLTALPLLLERCPRARITVITAGLTTEVRDEAMAKGAVNVIDKRVSLNDIKLLLASS